MMCLPSLHCAVLILLFAWAAVSSSLPTHVVELSDGDFEHRTQASSGQTTGVWAVLFDSSANPDSAWADVWSEFAADEEKEIIYAKVDVDTNELTKTRFNVEQIPYVLLLKDRQVFYYPGPYGSTVDAFRPRVADFVLTEHATLGGSAVPPPVKRKTWLEKHGESPMDFRMIIFGGCLLIGGAVMRVISRGSTVPAGNTAALPTAAATGSKSPAKKGIGAGKKRA